MYVHDCMCLGWVLFSYKKIIRKSLLPSTYFLQFICLTNTFQNNWAHKDLFAVIKFTSWKFCWFILFILEFTWLIMLGHTKQKMLDYSYRWSKAWWKEWQTWWRSSKNKIMKRLLKKYSQKCGSKLYIWTGDTQVFIFD